MDSEEVQIRGLVSERMPAAKAGDVQLFYRRRVMALRLRDIPC
ncbi:MAG: hypothetical protein ABI580_06775 [Burkholderiaceae bacterium]